jgi:histidinol-phosphate aminotransferase
MIRARLALERIPVYVPGRTAEDVARERGLERVVKLASNEVAYPPFDAALDAIARAANAVNRYPDNAGVALREAIAARCDVAVEQVILGGGSVTLCQQAMLTTVDADSEVVFGWPSFEAYPVLGDMVGADSTRVLLRDHRYDLDAMARTISERTRLVFVCNPNNPTGTAVGRAAVERFLAMVPDDLLVVLDEAYHEFVTDPDVPDGLELLPRHGNVVVLRTFSKAYGLAGLRVGYGIGHPETIALLRKTNMPFGVSNVAQAAALASLDAVDELDERVHAVIAERTRLVGALGALGVPVVESQANFVWLPVAEAAVVLAGYCEERGVVLRPFGGHGVRVTVGLDDENDRFLEVVESAVRDLSVVPAS